MADSTAAQPQPVAEPPKDPNIHEYAGGWITERKHTEIPLFLKLSYIVVAGGCVAYSIIYVNGEVNHADRGALVRQFNSVTGWSPFMSYFVSGLALLFGIVVVWFAFRKHED